MRSLESKTVRRQRTKEDELLQREWLWATSLSQERAGTQTILRIGHERWNIENQGFNELVNQWHADHIYHHEPNAIAAILLLLFLACNLFQVWVSRGLKPALRGRHTKLHFACRLKAQFYHESLAPP